MWRQILIGNMKHFIVSMANSSFSVGYLLNWDWEITNFTSNWAMKELNKWPITS